jgi:acyl dehydratase
MIVFESADALLAAVGRDLGVTGWMPVTQERVNLFADATDDHQWIHVDPVKAKDGPFGACVAHGYLTLSLAARFMPQLIEVRNMRMGVNYGCDKVRFPAAASWSPWSVQRTVACSRRCA